MDQLTVLSAAFDLSDKAEECRLAADAERKAESDLEEATNRKRTALFAYRDARKALAEAVTGQEDF